MAPQLPHLAAHCQKAWLKRLWAPARLIGHLIGPLIGRIIGRLIAPLIGPLIGHLIGPLIGPLMGERSCAGRAPGIFLDPCPSSGLLGGALRGRT